MSALYSSMNFQITPAATNEIAIGMKMADFATDS